MRKNTGWLTIILICLIMGVIFFPGCAQKQDNTQALEALKLAQRANDLQQLNNLMSLHAWYHAASMNDVELEKIWAKRDDIVWAQNSGYWVGQKSIKEYYGPTVARDKTKGSFVWHTITTPVVEVAGDRQTAKGVWYTPGVVGSFKDSKGDFNWMFEKYGVDFVMENGEWKIWHMHVYTDTAWPVGGAITARQGGPGGAPAQGGGQGAAPAAKAEKSGKEAGSAPTGQMKAPDKAVQNYKELSPDTEIVLVPKPPVPYKTWNETWSYVADGE
jgi:hypothetical protein